MALKQAGSEGQKGREIGCLAGWMRGIEREGNWLYYRLEERDRKGRKLTLLEAGGEGYKEREVGSTY